MKRGIRVHPLDGGRVTNERRCSNFLGRTKAGRTTAVIAIVVSVVVLLIAGLTSGLMFHFLGVSHLQSSASRAMTAMDVGSAAFQSRKYLVERASGAMRAFFYGSKFVDYEELVEFLDLADFLDIFDRVDWIIPVESSYFETYRDFVERKFKLPAAHLQELNRTAATYIPSNSVSLMLSYSIPLPSSPFESELGADLSLNASEAYLILKAYSTEELTFGLNGTMLCGYYAIVKTPLADALIDEDLQSGILRVSLDLRSFADELAVVTDNYNFDIRNGPDEEVVYRSSDDAVEELVPVVTSFSESFGDDVELTVSMRPIAGSTYFPSISDVAGKFVGLFVPFLFVPLVVVVVVLICVFILNWVSMRRQLAMIELVTSAMMKLDFDNADVKDLMEGVGAFRFAGSSDSSESGAELRKGSSERRIFQLMRSMVSRMIEFRQYIPQTLLRQIENGVRLAKHSSSRSETRFPSTDNFTISTDASGDGNMDGDGDGDGDGDASSAATSHATDRTDVSAMSGPGDISRVASTRSVVMMSVCFVEHSSVYERLRKRGKSAMYCDIFDRYITTLYHIVCDRYKGDFHGFRRSQAVFSWGAVSPRSDASVLAIRAAVKIVESEFFTDNPLGVRIVITKGEGFCGNFGSIEKKFKQFDVVGYPAVANESIVSSLMRCAHLSDAKIVLDERVTEDTKFVTRTFPIDFCVVAEEYSPVQLFELIEYVDLGEANRGEWMYELKNLGADLGESDSSSTLASPSFSSNRSVRVILECIHDLWERLIAGKIEEAREMYRSNREIFASWTIG